MGPTVPTPYPGARPRRGTPTVLYKEPKRNHFCDRDCRLGHPRSIAGQLRPGGVAKISSVRNLSRTGHAIRRNPEGRTRRIDPVRHGRHAPKILLAMADYRDGQTAVINRP